MSRRVGLCLLFGLALLLAGCQTAATPAGTPAAKVTIVQTQIVQPTKAPEATKAPQPTAIPATAVPTATPAATKVPEPTKAAEVTRPATATQLPAARTPTALPSTTATRPAAATQPVVSPTAGAVPTLAPTSSAAPTPVQEQRMIELEWPGTLRLGESDLVRLSIVPYQGGYIVQAEFPEHNIEGEPITVVQQAGFLLSGVARLDGVGFEISPSNEIEHPLPKDETVTWRWALSPRTAGQQRLSISLSLRWTPESGNPAAPRQQLAFSRGLTVQVSSVFGLSRPQALTVGFIGLVVGAGLGLGALAFRPRAVRSLLRTEQPNMSLVLEPRSGIQLDREEAGLLRALFNHYRRLAIESEFLSGYSGARTFLALPVHPDDRADAYTIVKIGTRESIQREAAAYEHYVKDRLPPVTARIQHAPVTLPGSRRAAVRYTFIAEPGRFPTSLRLALQADPNPALLWRLFETFGPNWWMQRRAVPFRWAQEYDRLLPPHLVLQPTPSAGRPALTLDEHSPPGATLLAVGDLVWVKAFQRAELRPDGASYALAGKPQPGEAPLRVRWLADRPPDGAVARVTATRRTLLESWSMGIDLHGLPDPLAGLEALLDQTVQGSRSIIHGDLNLENVLVGPGGFTWLIDFSETREGHPLFDFAHLAAEIVAHLYAPALSAEAYVARLRNSDLALLSAVEGIAGRCLFNPAAPAEYRVALRLACLGALKYPTLDAHARELLFLTAAWVAA